MPEGTYEAKARLEMGYWKRPRWFVKKRKATHLVIPKGVPVEGKGENAWDCRPDATYAMTIASDSIPEGVGKFVGHMLEQRVRYGGWSDWEWKKPRT